MLKVRTYMYQDVTVRNALTDSNGTFKVFRDLAPEGTDYPFVVWSLTGSTALNDIDCAANEDDFNIQFDIYASSEEERDRITRIVRMSINTFARVQGYQPIPPNDDGYFRESMTATTIDFY